VSPGGGSTGFCSAILAGGATRLHSGRKVGGFSTVLKATREGSGLRASLHASLRLQEFEEERTNFLGTRPPMTCGAPLTAASGSMRTADGRAQNGVRSTPTSRSCSNRMQHQACGKAEPGWLSAILFQLTAGRPLERESTNCKRGGHRRIHPGQYRRRLGRSNSLHLGKEIWLHSPASRLRAPINRSYVEAPPRSEQVVVVNILD